MSLPFDLFIMFDMMFLSVSGRLVVTCCWTAGDGLAGVDLILLLPLLSKKAGFVCGGSGVVKCDSSESMLRRLS